MKLKATAFLTMILSAIAGCSDDSGITKPNFEGKESTVQIAEQNWNKLLTACPGLNNYSSDLEYSGLSDWTILDKPMSRVEIKFNVSNDPSEIPNAFKAWGHTCGFGIAPDGQTLRIQKDVCVSVCKGSAYQNSGSDYVVAL